MSKLDNYKQRVLELHSKGLSSRKIVATLLEETGEKFSKSTVNYALGRWGEESGEEEATGNVSDTSNNDYTEARVLSALDDNHKLMDIDRYCEYYALPRKDITSYKLITHTGVPYYNLVFRELATDIEEIDFKSVIDDVVGGIYTPKKRHDTVIVDEGELVTRLIYTDTHIAMCTDSEETSMYATPWNEDALMETLEVMCQHVINNRVGTTLIIDDLGDVLDGWDGYTTRGGHKLPQNMSNQKAYKVALQFKMAMLDILESYFDTIICHNVCNDNHSGRFSMILNHAFMRLGMERYNHVEIINYERFIDHYFIGKHAMVLTHGKDSKSLKFGFKPKLDSIQIEKIEHYLKHNEQGSVYKQADFIWLNKGDSHLMLFDYSTAYDFNYMNYPALSPASEWIQNNYKKGDRGFVIEQINPQDRNIKPLPIIL